MKYIGMQFPWKVEKYLAYLHGAMIDNDLFRRMNEIHRDAISIEENSNLSSRIIDRYEVIDMLVGKLMYEAEDQCHTLHTWTISWYPAYTCSCLALEYWLKRFTYYKKSTTTLYNSWFYIINSK